MCSIRISPPHTIYMNRNFAVQHECLCQHVMQQISAYVNVCHGYYDYDTNGNMNAF